MNLNIENISGKNSSGKRSNNPLKRLTGSSITGDKVYSPDGQSLGKIRDIMIDITNGQVDYVIIEFGGFFGMNRKYLAVPFDALSIDAGRHHAFVLKESKDSLRQYSGFDKGHWPGTNFPSKPVRLYGYGGFMGSNTGSEY